MRAVIQRVKKASVTIDQQVKSSIDEGILIFLGIEGGDNDCDINWLAGKIARLRIFDDADGKMNHSVSELKKEALVISQFTLHASTKKGNRPSYIRAADPETAIPLYDKFISVLNDYLEKPVKTGEFGAMMDVALINDGPVTIIIDSKNRE